MNQMDPFSAELETRRFGRELVHHEVVDSTNLRAVAALREEPLPDGTVFLADRQTRGKGTGGRPWYSDDRGGLWFSLILQEPLAVHPLSFLPAIALVDLLAEDCGIESELKWPNDVLVQRRKIAGILVESQLQPDGAVAWVVGVGLNVNQERLPEPITESAVSMRMISGRRYRRPALWAHLLGRLERLTDQRADLVPLWKERSRMLGRAVRVRRGGQEFHVTASDLTPAGHLRVRHADGREEEWVSSADLEIEPPR